MPLTTSEANDVMRRMGRVFPTSIQMMTFKDKYEARRELGISIDAPAFYNAGTIYVILDSTDYDGCTMLVAHEIGHQFFDPGSIIPYYIVARLFTKVAGLGRHQIKDVQLLVNVYSDITVNNIVWTDKRFIAEFGQAGIEKAFEDFYRVKDAVDMMKSGSFTTFSHQGAFNFIRGGMALGYLRIHDPARYKTTLTIMPSALKTAYDKIYFLIQERDYAIREVQKYYEHAIELLKSMKAAAL